MAILSRCGYRCDLCQAYKANVAVNDQRRKVSELWGKYYGLDVAAENIGCDGCLNLKSDAVIADSGCPVRPCAVAKNIEHCGMCAGYPCELINTRIGLSAAAARQKLGDKFDQAEYDEFIFAYDNKARLDAAAKESTLKALLLRRETSNDYREAEILTREAFWNVNVPGCDEHYLLHIMREAPSFIPELDYLAVYQGKIIGQIVYTRALLISEQGTQHKVLSFGPLSVLPAYQGRGVGGVLIKHTLALAAEMGYRAVLIYGDPAYYSRLGFVAAEQYGIQTAEGKYHIALQAFVLAPGALNNLAGRFYEDEIYCLDPEASADFDRGFPAKEKLVTPSQARFLELLAQCHE
jgi:predicted N-acetyltransferase YhbS